MDNSEYKMSILFIDFDMNQNIETRVFVLKIQRIRLLKYYFIIKFNSSTVFLLSYRLAAFFTIATMGFTYSIANGICAGFIFYSFMKVLRWSLVRS